MVFRKIADKLTSNVDDSLDSYPQTILEDFLARHPMPHPPYNRQFSEEEVFALRDLNRYFTGSAFRHEDVYELMLVASLSMTKQERDAMLIPFYRDQFAQRPRLIRIGELIGSKKHRKILETIFFPPSEKKEARQKLIKQVAQTLNLPIMVIASVDPGDRKTRTDL